LFTRTYEYTIRTLNVAGPFPAVLGIAPLAARITEAFTSIYVDRQGSLGPWEWTGTTQLLPRDLESDAYPFHRAFIPRGIRAFDFDPLKHLEQDQSGGTNPHIQTVRFRSSFRSHLSACGLQILRIILDLRCLAKAQNLPPAFGYSESWHMGASWEQLMARMASTIPFWLATRLAGEAKRTLLDALGYIGYLHRQLLCFECHRVGVVAPRLSPSQHLRGLVVYEEDEQSMKIAQCLSELGAPIWTIKL
jgi:hypothetical protein